MMLDSGEVAMLDSVKVPDTVGMVMDAALVGVSDPVEFAAVDT